MRTLSNENIFKQFSLIGQQLSLHSIYLFWPPTLFQVWFTVYGLEVIINKILKFGWIQSDLFGAEKVQNKLFILT